MNIFSEFSNTEPLLLLGNGKMGAALLEGWLKAGLNPEAVLVVDPQNQSQNIKSFSSLLDLPIETAPKMIVLAVKPQIMSDVLKGITSFGFKPQLVLSIVAGFRISKIEDAFEPKTSIIRAIPNTPASIGKGISGIFGNNATGDFEMAFAESLMSACGPVVQVEKESLIDAVTAVSGSGPAYVFYMVEAMAKGGEAQGLSSEVAYQLARETIIGAGALLENSTESAKTLRENVTSPKGTTEAALNILMEDAALVKLMKKAIKAARDRSVELSEG
jgi:pyrroline-5-carboxylate reductase